MFSTKEGSPMIRLLTILSMFLVIIVSACSGSESKEGDYETTKKMVVDILNTEDGKKALEELLADEKMQQHLVMESKVVKDSINELLASEKGVEIWSKLFKDPTFTKDFAESMAKEQEQLMKSLMNDAQFQKQMLDLLQNPEITEQMLQLMKSQQFRSHLEETIQQTLETPLFQEKMAELLLEAAEKKNDSEEKSEKDNDEKDEDSDKEDQEE